MKKVLQQLGRYRKDTILCIIMAALEILMEILMPFITALIIDQGLEAANLNLVYRYGILMVVMALLSLVFGSLAGKCAASTSASASASASAGLSANLRQAIYNNIQTFSFSNIDKFSVPGLVTRMTTDITNVQNAFMMVIRIAVRAPLMLIFIYINNLRKGQIFPKMYRFIQITHRHQCPIQSAYRRTRNSAVFDTNFLKSLPNPNFISAFCTAAFQSNGIFF